MLNRFESKVDKTGDCWLWLAAKDEKGYGYFQIRNKVHKAHRIAWQLYRGPIPIQKWVLHHCDNPSCVNPDHLFLGTHLDNVADRQQKQRQAKGEGCAAAKITAQQATEIRMRYSQGGVLQRELADEFGITTASINKIWLGTNWKHLLRG